MNLGKQGEGHPNNHRNSAADTRHHLIFTNGELALRVVQTPSDEDGGNGAFPTRLEQERCRPLRLPPPVPLRTRPAVLLKGDRAAAWKLHRHADRQGGSEPWGGGRWARPRAENRMAVGSLVDTRPALRKTRPQRCGRGGQTTQEAVRKAAISGQRPRRRQPRKTDWSPHGPSRQQRPVAGAGWGRGSVLASPPVSLRRPSLSPSPAERGAQTATPAGSKEAPASRTRKPCAKSGLAPPWPLCSVSATSWESVVSKVFKKSPIITSIRISQGSVPFCMQARIYVITSSTPG